LCKLLLYIANTLRQDKAVDRKFATYSIASIVQGELYLMSTFLPSATDFATGYTLSNYLPTLVMWLAGLVASGLAAILLVTRHVRTLNRS